MSDLPSEPDSATALVCPDCGDPISPEGLAFLSEVGLEDHEQTVPAIGNPMAEPCDEAPEVVEVATLPTVRRIPMERPEKKVLAIRICGQVPVDRFPPVALPPVSA